MNTAVIDNSNILLQDKVAVKVVHCTCCTKLFIMAYTNPYKIFKFCPNCGIRLIFGEDLTECL